jgi:hypothetical protein
MSLRIFFKWFDLWIGLYIDWPRRVFYFCPIPCVGIRFQLCEMNVPQVPR